jgi:hypothetical protein
MALHPKQHLQIAAAYEKAAADYTVPPQHRKAFARKAEMFRMLARLGGKVKTLTPSPPKSLIDSASNSIPMLSSARHLFAWQQRLK